MTRPVDHAWSRVWAEKLLAIDPAAEHISDASENNLARAYLSILEAVEPLLAAAEKATPGPWHKLSTFNTYDAKVLDDTDRTLADVWYEDDAELIVAARNTASALRDLLGPPGGTP